MSPPPSQTVLRVCETAEWPPAARLPGNTGGKSTQDDIGKQGSFQVLGLRPVGIGRYKSRLGTRQFHEWVSSHLPSFSLDNLHCTIPYS